MVKLPTVTKKELLEAISDGVSDAMWRMIRNGTDMPCSDFFNTIGDAVKEAVVEVARETKR